MRNVFFFIFSTIMITGLGLFGLEDTGLGLEENWPWPRRPLALASNMMSSNPSLGILDLKLASCTGFYNGKITMPAVTMVTLQIYNLTTTCFNF